MEKTYSGPSSKLTVVGHDLVFLEHPWQWAGEERGREEAIDFFPHLIWSKRGRLIIHSDAQELILKSCKMEQRNWAPRDKSSRRETEQRAYWKDSKAYDSRQHSRAAHRHCPH